MDEVGPDASSGHSRIDDFSTGIAAAAACYRVD